MCQDTSLIFFSYEKLALNKLEGTLDQILIYCLHQDNRTFLIQTVRDKYPLLEKHPWELVTVAQTDKENPRQCHTCEFNIHIASKKQQQRTRINKL